MCKCVRYVYGIHECLECVAKTHYLKQGFKRAEENMNDIKLDAPNAPKVLFSLRADAEERALLEKTSS